MLPSCAQLRQPGTSHPPLRAARQRWLQSQHRARQGAHRRPNPAGRASGGTRRSRSTRRDRSLPAVPVLRRPHDHCRSLCTRRHTARPTVFRMRGSGCDPMTILVLSRRHPFAGTSRSRAAPVSSQRLQPPPEHHRPRLYQVAECVGRGQPAIIGASQLSPASPNSSPGKRAAPPNPHRRPSPHRFPAGSFFGGFRTPALLPGPLLAPGRHPKP